MTLLNDWFGKFSVVEIVREHWRTLQIMDTASYLDATRDGPRDWWTVGVLYGLPALLAGLAGWVGLSIGDVPASALLGAFAVLAGFLFNLLILLLDVIKRPEGTGHTARLRKETYATLSYCILIALVAVVLLAALVLSGSPVARPLFHLPPVVMEGISSFWDAVALYLSAHFVLNLFVVLKRINKLASREA
ncbi:hypothetical protein [Rubrivirga sp.]|uniref:hypothetical protein n=1 Tax=Rubrivirga sp. TaxID=1885344 RepID=UPI003B517EAB